jgi:hypothetical protein
MQAGHDVAARELSTEGAVFLDEFDRATNAANADLDAVFAPRFLALDPVSSHELTPQMLAKFLPARRAMFESAGVVNVRRTSATEQMLDAKHRLLRVQWAAERGHRRPVVLDSTFLVKDTETGMRIVVYLNHTQLQEELARP